MHARIRRYQCCILSKFYIKPQPIPSISSSNFCCILSKFYIKPQRFPRKNNRITVVSYRNSTSNHNLFRGENYEMFVVSYRNSTSNHNSAALLFEVLTLYLIEILHQTTTSGLILIDKVLLTGCLPL